MQTFKSRNIILPILPKECVISIALYFLLLHLITYTFPLFTAAQSTLPFYNLSVEDGLTQSTVYAILQDRDGFMWFGTRDGLNRYDGVEIRTYRTRPGNPYTLSHPNIRAIEQDEDGMIWLGTDGGGLNRFDAANDRFYNYPFITDEEIPNHQETIADLSVNQIISLAIDNDGRIWTGHRHAGVSRFDPDEKKFRHFNATNDEDIVPVGTVWDIEIDHEEMVWMGTEEGLWRYNGDGRFSHMLPDVPVWSIHADENGTLLVGTTSRGVIQVNPVTKQIQHIPSNNPLLGNLIFGSTGPVLVDDNELTWIAHADLGLFVWNRQNDEVQHIHSGLETDLSIRDNSIRTLYQDRNGMVWVGTNSSGVYSYSPVRKKFEHFPSSDSRQSIFSPPVTLSFTESPDGRIWVGTENAGVLIFDRLQNSFEALPYDPDNPEILNHQQIITLLTDRDGTIWIGTDGGGLEQWSADGTKINHYIHDPQNEESISNDSILFLYEDRAGRIWVGTYRGLNMKEPDSDNFTRYTMISNDEMPVLSDERILSIHEDSNGLIWIGTHGGGLNRLDPGSGEIRSYTPYDGASGSISSDRVNAITEDQQGRIWLGTYHGLNVFNPDSETFELYTDADGLASNIVRGIIRTGEDLWLSTNNGLSRFNIPTASIDNFSLSDGLQSSEFKGGAYFKSTSGELYFGGINGFNVFRPDLLPMNTNIPPVVLTDFRVSGESREINDIMVNLRHMDNVFSVRFAALDYVSPADNRYEYKLNGFDHDWIDAGNLPEARYTRVPPGNYEFRVRAANNDGVWNTEGAVLLISIKPPFWLTWWFITLSVLSVILLGFTILRVRSNLRQREEHLRQKIARNLHDDISGSLSSIDLFAAAIEREKYDQSKSGKYLSLITESAREAKGKISDIIWYVDPLHDDWHSLANRLHRFADTLFEAASISCKFRIKDLPDEPLNLEVRQNLWLVVKELLTNIIRHSRASHVNINLSGNSNKITIEIQDNGIGFDQPADLEGNGIDNVIQRCNSIGAKAKLETSPGNGTRWNITLGV